MRDSEKYQFRKWDWDRPGHIARAGRAASTRSGTAHRALQFDDTLRFHETDNPRDHRLQQDARPTDRTRLLDVVNLDPHHMQHGHVRRAGRRRRRDLHRPRSARRRDVHVARRLELRALRSGHPPGTHSEHRWPTDDSESDRLPVDAATPASAAARRRRSALVQGRDHLPGARQVVLRQQQRRHRRLPGPDAEARLPAGPRHHLPLAAAVLPVAAQRRRLRHRRLPERPSELRHARRLQGVRRRGARRGTSRC